MTDFFMYRKAAQGLGRSGRSAANSRQQVQDLSRKSAKKHLKFRKKHVYWGTVAGLVCRRTSDSQGGTPLVSLDGYDINEQKIYATRGEQYMRHARKNWLAAALALVMALTLLPANALAAFGQTRETGTRH